MAFTFPKLLTSYGEWLEKQQSSILSAAIIITGANLASSASGLIRSRLLISLYFDTAASKQAYEALLIAFQIPDLMFQLIVLGAISAAFIPIFSTYRHDKQAEREYMQTMMTSIVFIMALVATVVFIFAEQITQMRTGHQFTAEQVQIAANLTRIMMGAQFFFAISNLLTGMLQSYKRFVIPALSPIFYNVGIVLGAYLLSPQFGIYAAGIGVVIGAFLHMIIQLPLALKLGFRPWPRFDFQHPGLKTTFKLTPARTATLSIAQFQQLSDGFFTTSIGNLSFVVMNLANTLMTMPIRFFGVPIGQAALPFLADEANQKDLTTFRDLVLKSIHQISFFSLPASVLLLILRVPIVRLAFGTPNFPWETTLSTARVVAILAISISAQAIVQLLARAFHALKDTKIPLFITLAVAALDFALSAFGVFVLKQGVLALAAAATFTTILEMLLFLWLLDRRVHGFARKAFWVPQLKMLTATFLMAVFLYLPFKILDELVFNTSRTIELILLTLTTGTVGMLVYIYFAALFDIRELYMISTILDKLGSWQKTLFRSREVILETPTGQDEL